MASPMSLFRKAFLPRTPATLNVARVRYASNGNPGAQREAQKDREKIDTQANEYAKSGTDDTAAKDAAFDPKTSNDPDQARKEMGDEMDVSPANTELSSGTSEVSPGADKKQSEGGGGRQGGGDSTGNKHGGSSV